MAMDVGDIIEIRSHVDYLGQECLNVWHYQVVSFDPGVSYPQVDDAFNSFWTLNIKPITMNSAVLSQVEILNLTNGVDIHTEDKSIAGDKTGDGLASFYAWKFQFFRGSRITRHGWKRITGVCEVDVAGNAAVAGALTALNSVAGNMLAGLLVSGGSSDLALVPVIVGRTLVGGVYTLDLTKINSVIDVGFSGVTTQNTRKA